MKLLRVGGGRVVSSCADLRKVVAPNASFLELLGSLLELLGSLLELLVGHLSSFGRPWSILFGPEVKNHDFRENL